MIDLMKRALPLIRDRRAITALDYALIAAFIALVISGTMTLLERS